MLFSRFARLLVVAAAFANVSGATPFPLAAGESRESSVAKDHAQQPDDPDPIVVWGHERMAWDYEVVGPPPFDEIEFVAYVDDARVRLDDVRCDNERGPTEFTCSSRLPSLTPGVHVIRVTANQIHLELEGPSSPPIHVHLERGLEGAQLTRDQGVTASVAGLPINASVVTDRLADAMDLAVLPDGRVLIAERSGRFHVLDDNGLTEVVANLRDTNLRDIRGTTGGLLALAVDPQFESTQAVYVVHSVAHEGARLTRLRLHGNGLVNAAVLLEGLPLAPRGGSTTLAVGPDGKLYLALDDGGEPGRADDWGSFQGKVLRLNLDGTTPHDSAGHSPIFHGGMSRPAGIDWIPGTTTMAIVGVGRDQVERLYRVQSVGPPYRGRHLLQEELPAGFGAADVLAIDESGPPALHNHLLIAGQRGVLRVPPGGRTTDADLLVGLPAEEARALGLSPNGEVYVLTPRSLVRLSVR